MDWFIVHIVSGYSKRDNKTASEVYVQETLFAVHASSFDEARKKADIIVAKEREPSRICIVDPESQDGFFAKCIGVELRQIMEVSFLSEELGDGQIKNGSELTYFPMIFSSKEDFFDYASASDGHKKINVQLYKDPNDYHFGA